MGTPAYRDPAILEELYHDQGMTQEAIGDELGCSAPTVSVYMKRHGIETDRNGDQDRDEEPIRMVRSRGYSAILHHGHHVLVHRLAAVAKYGIDAVANNVVHHRDGHRNINHPDNLELRDKHSHQEHHMEERFNIEDTSYRDEATLIWLFENLGMTQREIADQYTVSEETIRYHLERYGLKDRPGVDGTTETVDEDPQHSLSEFTESAAD